MRRNAISLLSPTKHVGTKIMLGMVLTSLLVMTVVTAGLLNKYQADARSNKIKTWESNAQIIALDAELSLTFSDETAAQETLSTLKRDTDLVDAYILTPDGKALAAFKPAKYPADPFGCLLFNLDKQVPTQEQITIREPVEHDGQELGWVVARYDLTSLKAMQQDNIAFAIYIGGAGILLAILISIPIRILIQRPIQELAGVARQVSDSKDYSVRARQMTRDELGELTTVFNEMLSQVEQHGQEMLTINEQLDDKVQQRTEELEHALARVEAASAAKTDFLANMSHEIRTPMTSIIGYSELLLNPKHSPSDRLDCIQTIRRNGEHLLGIINDILDISKIEAGKMTIEKIDCDPVSVVADVASIMRMRALSKGLTFEVDYIGAIPERIETDPTRLRQILVNLIGNATKFTSTGGSIRLVIQCSSEQATGKAQMQFQVVDTGIGISEDALSRLFQPFTQADETMTRRFGGTGLGLTISKYLCEQLGGGITVHSHEGAGSTFTFTIDPGTLDDTSYYTDAREAHARVMTQAQAAHAETLAGAYRGHILLAEDGLDNQRLISQVLTFYGFQVQVVENGQEAYDNARKEDGTPAYDAILMDMQMPVLDGYRATNLLRTEGYDGPIIALTAHAMASDRQRCLDAGCDDYTTKPIDRQQLLELLVRYIPQEHTQPLNTSAEQTTTSELPDLSQTGGTSASTVSSDDASSSPEALYSTFKDDPVMADMIEPYLNELEEQVRVIVQAVQAADYERLAVLSHQMKGAAGGYGYPAITDAARALEMKAKERAESEAMAACADELAALAALAVRSHVSKQPEETV